MCTTAQAARDSTHTHTPEPLLLAGSINNEEGGCCVPMAQRDRPASNRATSNCCFLGLSEGLLVPTPSLCTRSNSALKLGHGRVCGCRATYGSSPPRPGGFDLRLGCVARVRDSARVSIYRLHVSLHLASPSLKKTRRSPPTPLFRFGFLGCVLDSHAWPSTPAY